MLLINLMDVILGLQPAHFSSLHENFSHHEFNLHIIFLVLLGKQFVRLCFFLFLSLSAGIRNYSIKRILRFVNSFSDSNV